MLRISLGAVFLGFGVLKYLPGVSPAQDLAVTTTRLLTFGLIPDSVALVLVATLECVIGVLLLSGRWLRVALGLLAVELVGILSPVALLPARLFAGPGHGPTLEGQYVLKDVILAAAVLVIAVTVQGGRLVGAEHEAAAEPATAAGAHRRPTGIPTSTPCAVPRVRAGAASSVRTGITEPGRHQDGWAQRSAVGRTPVRERAFSCVGTLVAEPDLARRVGSPLRTDLRAAGPPSRDGAARC